MSTSGNRAVGILVLGECRFPTTDRRAYLRAIRIAPRWTPRKIPDLATGYYGSGLRHSLRNNRRIDGKRSYSLGDLLSLVPIVIIHI